MSKKPYSLSISKRKTYIKP